MLSVKLSVWSVEKDVSHPGQRPIPLSPPTVPPTVPAGVGVRSCRARAVFYTNGSSVSSEPCLALGSIPRLPATLLGVSSRDADTRSVRYSRQGPVGQERAVVLPARNWAEESIRA